MKKLVIVVGLLLSLGLMSSGVSAQGRASRGPDPSTQREPDIEADSLHNLNVAKQYFKLRKAYKASLDRCEEIIAANPNFSRMAEVLFRLATTYMEEEEPDEATKYFQRLVAMHPNSDFTEKAKEKLASIGAQVPPTAKNAVQEEPTGPSFFGGLMQQISGSVPKTVAGDGVIISRSSKGGSDIIDDVIKNNGTLPDNYNTKHVTRTAPARDVRPLSPAPAPKANADGSKGVNLEPARPGAPANGADPSKPAATQPTTPATPPPGTKP
jgi:hypothetical protein